MSISATNRLTVAVLVAVVPVLVVALTGSVVSAAPASAVRSTTSVAVPRADGDGASWFRDPRTAAQRRVEVPVTRRSMRLTGRLRETRAVYRTAAGDLAVPVHFAAGHQLARGHALTLDGPGLFSARSTQLTAAAAIQVGRAAASLVNASSIRCEGHADYGGERAHARRLATARAQTVCRGVAARREGLATTVLGLGAGRPAVVAGSSRTRVMNRRVVVVVTGVRPPVPPTPVPPPTGTPSPTPTPAPTPEASVPGAPVIFEGMGLEGWVLYRFKVPTHDGGAEITSYEVSTGGGWARVSAPRGTYNGCQCGGERWGWLEGIPVGSWVDIRVRAVNRVGAGPASEPWHAPTHGVPTAPTNLQAVCGDGTVAVSFDVPENTGALVITSYEITVKGDGFLYSKLTPTGEGPWTSVWEGLPIGDYEVVVRAVNELGAGPDTMPVGCTVTGGAAAMRRIPVTKR